MSVGSRDRPGGGLIVHNWPLKLAAIALATLLYAGLVASQDSITFPGPVPVTAINQPPGTVVTNDLRDVEQIRYIAPADVARLRAEDFEATVDLTNVKPDGQQVNVRVAVNAIDPRVTILDSQPRTIQVVLDEVTTKLVPVEVDQATPPAGHRRRRDDVHAAHGQRHRPVDGREPGRRRARERRPVPGGHRLRPRPSRPKPVDEAGDVVTGVDLDPRSVHVTIPLFTNRETRTLPVNPIVTGTPAQGFRIASVEVDPLIVSVEGDADQLAGADAGRHGARAGLRAPRATSPQSVALALPSGVVAVDARGPCA